MKTVTTKSKPTAFPSALRSKRSAVQTLTADDVQADATIRETCPDCGREEMRYYTLQLRGADEGSTVFFTCECGHKYVICSREMHYSRGCDDVLICLWNIDTAPTIEAALTTFLHLNLPVLRSGDEPSTPFR